MKKSDLAVLLLILLTFGIGLYYYPQLPEQMPIHWNINGEVDNYGDKLFATFLFPAINLLMFVFFLVLPKIDPRKENYQKFKGAYTVFRNSMHIFLAILYLLTIQHSLNKDVPDFLNIDFVVPLGVSILFIIIGNYLGKIQDNYFIGIRTPWTLSSEKVWYKTHRLAGKLYVVSGIFGVIGSFFGGMIAFILLIVPISLSSLYIILYSYLEYKKENK